MSFSDVPKDTLKKFKEYHESNPEIWKAFKRYAFEAYNAGIRKYGAKGIMERVRWHSEIESKGKFKISNSFTAYYARALAKQHPEFREFFNFKEIKGINAEQ